MCIRDRFDGIFISDQIGYEKPDIRFFDHIWKQTGVCEKDDVLIVGAVSYTHLFQPVGASTEKFAKMQTGDFFEDFVGPLGCPSEFVNEDLEELKKEKLLFVAGGVGTAPVYPQVKWLHEHGIDADVIVGAKTKDLIILEKEMEEVAGNLYITTDDGTYGRHEMCIRDRI